jgi:hypothetical protein
MKRALIAFALMLWPVIASAEGPTDTEVSYLCGSESKDDAATCQRCLTEALENVPLDSFTRLGSGAVIRNGPERVRLPKTVSSWQACRYRLNQDRTERQNLVDQIKSVRLETLSDAELGTVSETLRPLLTRLVEVGADLEAKRLTDSDRARIVEGSLAIVSADVTKEKACRVDAKCMAKRREAQFVQNVVNPMCEADQEREEALSGIAHENANPSGYVNKLLLHRLGMNAQDAQEKLASLVPSYVKVRHHAWKGWRSECVLPDDGGSQ